MKDPILQTYTFEELLYEYHSIAERQKAELEQVEEEADKIELDKEKVGQDWADQMEAEDAAKEAAEEAQRAADPSLDPDNVKWMDEQIQKEKEIHGESFGEDLNLDFNSSEK